MILSWPIKNVSGIPPISPNPQDSIYISQKFGEHPEIYAQFGLKGHDGLDIAAPLDTKIYAPHDGVIQFFTDANYGKDIRLYFDEGGITWDIIFGHLHKYEGQPRTVKTEDLIGYVDSTGFSTGNHLHFGVRRKLNGVVLDYSNGYFGYLDPMQFLKGTEMILFKGKTSQTVYAQNGDTLTGFDSMTSYNKFTEGRNPVIVLLDPEELNKFIISPVVIKL